VARVRIRGSETEGQRGGRIGFVWGSGFTTLSDFIIDGVDMNGHDGPNQSFGQYCGIQFSGPTTTRVFVHNVRAISGARWWLGTVTHLMIANTNVYASAMTRAQSGVNEGWLFRDNGGPHCIVDCQLQTTRYHVVRPFTKGGSGELFFAYNTDLIGVAPASNHVWSNNTFSSLTTLPAWGGPGDPRDVPLPNNFSVITGEGVCQAGA
jgi:hypothetical protein